eukprot:378104_1
MNQKNEHIDCSIYLISIMLIVLFINVAVFDYLGPNDSITNQFTSIKQSQNISTSMYVHSNKNNTLISYANITENDEVINGIVIFTVPKCGTFFLADIVTLFIDINTNIYNRLEMSSIVPHITNKRQIGEKKFFATHEVYISFSYLLNKHYNMIVGIRNPIDVTISSYFFYEKRKPEKQQLFIYNYTLANIEINSNKILKNYQHYVNNMNRCILNKFEDLIFDFNNTIKGIYQFISRFAKSDTPNYDLIAKMLDFETVHRQEKQNGIYKVGKIQKTLFHRSGKVGQAKEHFTNNQIATIIKLIPNDIYEIYPKHMYLDGLNIAYN